MLHLRGKLVVCFYITLCTQEGGKKERQSKKKKKISQWPTGAKRIKQKRLTVNSSEPSRHCFRSAALTVVKWSESNQKIRQNVMARRLVPLRRPPRSALLYSRCAETLAVRTRPAASLSRGLHGYPFKKGRILICQANPEASSSK